MQRDTAKKQILSRLARIGYLMRLYLTASICVLVFVPLILSWFGYEPKQTLLAILLFEVCLYPTIRYFARKESGLPAMPVLCMAYALQFAVPFFTHDATIELAGGEVKYLSDSDVS